MVRPIAPDAVLCGKLDDLENLSTAEESAVSARKRKEGEIRDYIKDQREALKEAEKKVKAEVRKPGIKEIGSQIKDLFGKWW